MRLVFAVGILSLALAGCAGRPSETSQAEAYNRAAQRLSGAMDQAIDGNRAFDPIRGKVGLKGVNSITFEMLANTNKPTETERAAILEYAKLRDTHVKQARALEAQYEDPYTRINEAQSRTITALLADLYNGSLSYGEFAKKRQEIAAVSDEARERILSALAADADREEQAYLNRLNSYLLRQPTQPLQQPAPRLRTTCTRIGNTVFCN